MCHLSTELKKTKKCGDYWWKSKFKCQSKGFRYIKYQGTHCAKGSRKVSQLSINSNFYKFLFKYYLLIQVAHRDCLSRWNTISTDSTRHVQLYLMHLIVIWSLFMHFAVDVDSAADSDLRMPSCRNNSTPAPWLYLRSNTMKVHWIKIKDILMYENAHFSPSLNN